MIVVSDDEEEMKEIKEKKKMGSQCSTVNPAPEPVASCSSNSDDVCVVGEVTPYKKHQRGVVIAPSRTQDARTYTSNIRRRIRPETNSSVRFCTIRRNTNICPTIRYSCNSFTMRRKLFQLEESIRLEERRKYIELIQNIVGVSMVVSSHIIANQLRNTYFSKVLPVPPPPPLASLQPRSPKHRTVEYVDLASDSDSDTDNDIVEVPKESKLSKEQELVKKLSPKKDEVIDLEEESEVACSSPRTLPLQEDVEVECVFEKSVVEKADDIEDTVVTVENEPQSTQNEPKGNLEQQMLQQMIINDDSGYILGEAELSREEQEEEDELEASLPSITHDMQVLVHKAFSCSYNKVLMKDFGLTIYARDIHTLKGGNWLNDEVINYYMCLLMERGKIRSYPHVYCFNTFFYVKLMTSGYSSLRRWTRKIDIFSYDLLIVPLHLKVHWCLACINFIQKRIEYYDSMGGKSSECCQTLLKYLEEEHLDKKQEIFNTSGWELVNMMDIPEQLNGSDCGVFLCTYAEFICRLAKLNFTQRDMPYFRVKMAYEIISKKLLL